MTCIAAGNGKQVIIQGLREAEREKVYGEFNSKEKEILTGVVTRIDPRNGAASLRIGTGAESTEALLLAGEQVPGEPLEEGMHIKVYVDSAPVPMRRDAPPFRGSMRVTTPVRISCCLELNSS